MSYKTPMNKAKIFAELANFEDQRNRKGRNTKNVEYYNWCLDAIVQLETDYDLLGEPNGGFENEEYDILWKNRTKEDKTNVNNRVRWVEEKYIQEFPYWMIATHEDPKKFQIIQLVESLKHQPVWNIRIKYASRSSSKELETQIKQTFDRHFRAGNVNFSLQKTKWTKCLDS
jgi:hypothetical protein